MGEDAMLWQSVSENALVPGQEVDHGTQEFWLSPLPWEQNLYPVPTKLSVHDWHVPRLGANDMLSMRVAAAAV